MGLVPCSHYFLCFSLIQGLFSPKYKIVLSSNKNYSHVERINSHVVKINYHVVRKYSHAERIIMSAIKRNYISSIKKFFLLQQKRKRCVCLVFCSLIRNFERCSKHLSFGLFQINLDNRSLIRNFAAQNKIYFINSKYGKCNQIT